MSGILLGIASVAGALVALRLRVPVSASLPRGIYREVDSAPVRGAVVLWCIPEPAGRLALERGYLQPGNCPGAAAPVGKLVLATAGDTLQFGPDGVRLRGRFVKNSRPLRVDAAGRPLRPAQYGTYVLRAGDAWLWSPYTYRSFDSRYFGPVQQIGLRAVLRPVWTVSPRFWDLVSASRAVSIGR